MEKGIIKSFYESRVEDISILTESERFDLADKKNKIQLEDYVKDLSARQKDQIKEYFETVMTNVYDECAEKNEKYYQFGFSDGMNVAIDSFKLRPEIERRFAK